MKQALVLAVLAIATFFYFHQSASATSAAGTDRSARVVGNTAQALTIVAAPSSYNRWKTGPDAQSDWKTGPTAQNDWKTGPNAQTNFEPFAPNEQLTWNQSPGLTMAPRPRTRIR